MAEPGGAVGEAPHRPAPSADRAGELFVVAVLVLAAGVPVTLFGIYYSINNLTTLALGVMALLVCGSVAGILVARYRDLLFTKITGRARAMLAETSAPLIAAARAMTERDAVRAAEEAATFLQQLAARNVWAQTRKWIVSSSVALVVAFAGLIGAALLKQQNDLIGTQNSYLRTQVSQQQAQLDAQQALSSQAIRGEAIDRIYGPAFASSPRVKAEAVRALVAVERVYIASGRNTLPTDYINLHAAELAGAWLDGADLRKVSFRRALLPKAILNGADLTAASMRFTDPTAPRSSMQP